VEDARVGLGEAAALRCDHGLEERREPGSREARALHAVDAVGHDAQAVALAERPQHRPTARQAVAARREPVEVDRAEPGSLLRIAADLAQQAAEALLRERGLRDLAAAKGGPQLVIDALVRRVRRAGTGQAERVQGLAQCGALGPVEVEQRPIDVEEDGAEAGQGPTWRGR
jgi:hypothetical protein